MSSNKLHKQRWNKARMFFPFFFEGRCQVSRIEDVLRPFKSGGKLKYVFLKKNSQCYCCWLIYKVAKFFLPSNRIIAKKRIQLMKDKIPHNGDS